MVLLALLICAIGGVGLTFTEELAQVSLTAPPTALVEARQDYEDRWNAWTHCAPSGARSPSPC